MWVSLASLMCIRCLLRRGIPGYTAFDGGDQAALLLNHLLHGTVKGLGRGELPANHTLEKASRDCLMAASEFARRGMLKELGDREPFFDVLLRGWRDATLFSKPLVDQRRRPEDRWLKAFTRLVRDSEKWDGLRVEWTQPPATDGTEALRLLEVYRPQVDPEMEDDLDRELRRWISFELQEWGPAPPCWTEGLERGFLSGEGEAPRLRFFQAWCLFFRDKINTTPELATSVFGHVFAVLVQRVGERGTFKSEPDVDQTARAGPGPTLEFSAEKQAEWVAACTTQLREQLAREAGPLVAKADEILHEVRSFREEARMASAGLRGQVRLLSGVAGVLVILTGMSSWKTFAIDRRLERDARRIEVESQNLAHISTKARELGRESPASPWDQQLAQATESAANRLGLSREAMEQRLKKEATTTRQMLDRTVADAKARGARLFSSEKLRKLIAPTEVHLGDEALISQDYRKAIDSYRRALDLTERADDPEAWSEMTYPLTAVLRIDHRFPEATALLRELVDVREQLYGENEARTLVAKSDLGLALQAQGELAEAETLLRHVLEVRQCTLGPEDEDTLISVNNLGALLRQKGDLSTVETVYRDALQRARSVAGEESFLTLTLMSNLALHLGETGQEEEAESLGRTVIALRTRTLGASHERTLQAQHNLALLLGRLRRFGEAEALFNETIPVLGRTLGIDHPYTLTSREKYAEMLMANEEWEKAESGLELLLGLRSRKQGDAHEDTVATMRRLADVKFRLEDFDGAEPLRTEALQYLRRTRGDENPDTLLAAMELSQVFYCQGNGLKALELAEWAENQSAGASVEPFPARQAIQEWAEAVRKRPPKSR